MFADHPMPPADASCATCEWHGFDIGRRQRGKTYIPAETPARAGDHAQLDAIARIARQRRDLGSCACQRVRVFFGVAPSLSRAGVSRRSSGAVQASVREGAGAAAVVGVSTQLKRGVGSATRRHSKPSAKAV